MSGPKSYSVDVFNKQLKKIFSLQSEINQVFNELLHLSVNDKDLNISFDCNDFIKANINLIKKELKNYNLKYKGIVGVNLKRKIDRELSAKINSLQETLDKVKQEKQSFLNKKEDYETYVSYSKLYENSMASFNKFKEHVKENIEKNISDDSLDLLKKSKEKISEIKPEIKKENFRFGFRNVETKNKLRVIEKINTYEEQVSDIRNEIAKDAFKKSLSAKSQKSFIKTDKNNEEEIKKLKSKINDKIDLIENDKKRNRLRNEFAQLEKSQVFTDVYYYKEFIDKISHSERTQRFKKEIKNIIFLINNSETHQSLKTVKNKIVEEAINVLESDEIKSYRFEDILAQYKAFADENSKIIEEEFVKERENEFIKSQIVNGLINLNYKVMDDLQVIDFEKNDEFLLKVPNQNNYINVHVNKNNKIDYHFLIDEQKEDLSLDEKRQKVAEMEHTCSTFKNVLKDLEKMGLTIKQTKDSGAGIDKIMQVPEKYRDKISAAKEERRRAMIEKQKKRYLD